MTIEQLEEWVNTNTQTLDDLAPRVAALEQAVETVLEKSISLLNALKSESAPIS